MHTPSERSEPHSEHAASFLSEGDFVAKPMCSFTAPSTAKTTTEGAETPSSAATLEGTLCSAMCVLAVPPTVMARATKGRVTVARG